jgi:hypothetical protein
MAATTTEKSTRTAYGPELMSFEPIAQAMKDVFGFQLRTARTMIDQGLVLTKKASEQMTIQIQEGAKVQQDAMKYGLTLMEDFKKVVFETADKALKTDTTL